MKKIFYPFIILSLLGCSQVQEVSKTIWGSSTRKLSEARTNAITRTFDCTYSECYELILSLAKNQKNDGLEKGSFDVFQQDRENGFIIIMGIKGNVDTTEVGIFFERRSRTMTEIDIASLSSSAKRKMASLIFKELGIKYNEIL